MINLRVALRTLADLLEFEVRRIGSVAVNVRRGRESRIDKLPGRLKTVEMRTEAIRLIRSRSVAVSTHAEVDPAILGYLCAFVRGDYQSLVRLHEYLVRRQDAQACKIRDVNTSDFGRVVLTAFGIG